MAIHKERGWVMARGIALLALVTVEDTEAIESVPERGRVLPTLVVGVDVVTFVSCCSICSVRPILLPLLQSSESLWWVSHPRDSSAIASPTFMCRASSLSEDISSLGISLLGGSEGPSRQSGNEVEVEPPISEELLLNALTGILVKQSISRDIPCTFTGIVVLIVTNNFSASKKYSIKTVTTNSNLVDTRQHPNRSGR